MPIYTPSDYDLLIIDIDRDTSHIVRIFDDVCAPGSTIGDRIDKGTYVQPVSERFVADLYEYPLLDRRPLPDGAVRHTFHCQH